MNIVAIGGGEIGRPGFPVETLAIDKEIIRLSGKKRPKLLFIPTASSDSKGYCDTVQQHFGKRLGCSIDSLLLLQDTPSMPEIKKKIMSADIIYVGGGNTQMMIRVWKKFGVDKLLPQAGRKGTVLSGVSAGSMCWFRGGISDSRRFKNPDASLIKISCLGLIQAFHAPHFDAEKDRRPALQKIMRATKGVAVALDNCAALEIVGDTYRVITSKKTARAYKTYWKAGQYFEEPIQLSGKYAPLPRLLTA